MDTLPRKEWRGRGSYPVTHFGPCDLTRSENLEVCLPSETERKCCQNLNRMFWLLPMYVSPVTRCVSMYMPGSLGSPFIALRLFSVLDVLTNRLLGHKGNRSPLIMGDVFQCIQERARNAGRKIFLFINYAFIWCPAHAAHISYSLHRCVPKNLCSQR